MASLQTSLQTLIRTPMLDASGLITREWTLFMQQLIKSLNVTDDLQAQIGYVLDSTSSVFTTLRSFAYQGTANQSIANGLGSGSMLTFDTNAFDVGGIHSTSVNPTRFTAPVTGVYQVWGQFQIASATSGALQIQIAKNGTVLSAPSLRNTTSQSGGIAWTIQASALLQLTASDYIEFQGAQSTGGAVNSSLNVCAGSMIFLGS